MGVFMLDKNTIYIIYNICTCDYIIFHAKQTVN